jgi:LmbE family N-acetylglucosaminyl deacetylase
MALVEKQQEQQHNAAGQIMLNLSSLQGKGGPLVVLCFGAHSDDIEIGCGGTLLRLMKTAPELRLHWVVLCASGIRGEEAAKGAEKFAGGHVSTLELKNFRDGFLPYDGAEVKDSFEAIKSQVNPDLIFTHWSGDAHQDHRLVSELTWNTFRNHSIFEYEIPKYDGDIGRPNMFVPLESSIAGQKVDHLLDVFASQSAKPWFTKDLFMGLMRIRGMESNSPSGYAEAFHCRKLVIQ